MKTTKIVSFIAFLLCFTLNMRAQSGSFCEDPIPVGTNYTSRIESSGEVWYQLYTYDLPLEITFVPDADNSDWGPEIQLNFTCTPGIYDDPQLDDAIKTLSNKGMNFPIEFMCDRVIRNGKNIWNLSIIEHYRDLLKENGIAYNVPIYVKITYSEAGTVTITPSETLVQDTIYFVNVNDWTGVYVYVWKTTSNTINAMWPGVTATKEIEQIAGKDVYSFTDEVGKWENVIFNNNVGSQTADLTWTSGKYYVIDDWYTKEEAEMKLTSLTQTSYTVAGAPEIVFGTDWDPTNTDNDMVKQADSTYKWEKTELELTATTVEFKICEDHTWDVSYPTTTYELAIPESGIYTITIMFDPTTKTIDATATRTGGEVIIPTVVIAGDMNGWSTTKDVFTMAADGLTASLTLNLEANNYDFKMIIGETWFSDGATITRENNSVVFSGDNSIENSTFSADIAGEYTFTWTYASKTLVVTYPVISESTEPVYEENTLNPFAFDLSSALSNDTATLTVNYSLNNSRATSVNVVVYNGTEVVTTVPGTTTIGKNTVEVATAGLPAGVQLTWSVVVNGTSVATPTQEAKLYNFYHPSTIAIDNNPENETFGLILTNESMHSVKDLTDYVSSGYGAGIYAFAPSFDPIPNGTNPGYNGGIEFTKTRADGTGTAYAPRRIRISEDGRIFATSLNTDGNYLWEINPQNMNVWTPIFQGTLNENKELVDASGNFVAAPNTGFDVKGSGSNLQLMMYSVNLKGITGADMSGFRCDEYNLGTATSWISAPSKNWVLGKYAINYTGTQVVYDNEGGVWIASYRGTASDANPGLVHINADGVEDAKLIWNMIRQAGIRFNNDFTKLVVAGNNGAAMKATIYSVSKDENGAPVLTEETVIDMSVIGKNLNDFAFDYAGNLYSCSNSNEKLAAWAMPYSGKVETPAASKFSFAIGTETEIIEKYVTICYGESYTWDKDGKTYTATGRYKHYTDSITYILNLTILPEAPTMNDYATICHGETYTWNSQTYSAEGEYSITLQDINGCDSVVILNLTVLPEVSITEESATICHDETYIWNGQTYSTEGEYSVTLSNINGCDSIATLHLSIMPKAKEDVQYKTINKKETPFVWDRNGKKYFETITDSVFVQYTHHYCDSIIYILDLTVVDIEDVKSEYDTICESALPYEWNGLNITNGGRYEHTEKYEDTDIDVLTVLYLTITPTIRTQQSATICYGETFDWNGSTFNQTGDYTYTTEATNGCDSIITLHLAVLPQAITISTDTMIAHADLPYQWRGQDCHVSGEYTDAIPFAANSACDSVIFVLNLVVEATNKCGTDLSWEYDNGLLTITGSGAMYDSPNLLSYRNESWYPYRIRQVALPDGITHLGNVAFADCANLTNIAIPSSVTSIGDGVFSWTGLQSITIPANVTDLGEQIFESCSALRTLLYEGTPSSINNQTIHPFIGCVHLDTVIAPAALWHCTSADPALEARYGVPHKARYIEVTDGELTDKAMEYIAYNSGSLEVLDLTAATNTTLPLGALMNATSLSTLYLPQTIHTIPEMLAEGCHNLSEIIIPATATEIGNHAFAGCTNVWQITSEAVLPPTIYPETFKDIDRSISVIVPAGSEDAYRQAPYWQEFFIEQTTDNAPAQVNKVLRNDRIYILRNGKIYSIMGQQVQTTYIE